MSKRVLFILLALILFRLGTATALDDSLPPPPDYEGSPEDDHPVPIEEIQSDLEALSSAPQIKLRLRLSRSHPLLDRQAGLVRQSYLMESVTVSNARLTGHLTIEKDPGEASPTDFLAGYLEIRRLRDTGSLVFGHYRPGYGQGLVFSRWSRNVFSPEVSARQDAPSVGFTSTGENSALRGLFVSMPSGALELSAMVSDNRFDATLGPDGRVEARRETGRHVTTGELKARDAQRERLAGLHWRVGRGAAGLGGSALLAKLSPPFSVSRARAASYGPHGDRVAIAAVDWNTDALLPVQLFGEYACGGMRRSALLAGAILRRRTTDVRLLVRYYSAEYGSPYGAGFSSSGESTNEAGLLARMRWHPRRSTVIGVWWDAYRQPTISLSRQSTSAGSRFGLSAQCRPGRGIAAVTALGVRTSASGRPPRAIFLRSSATGEVKWAPVEWCQASAHAELTRAQRILEAPAGGSNARLGVRINPARSCLFEWRMSRFDIEAYDARITEVDYEAPSATAPDILTSTGTRHHVRLSYQGHRLAWSASYRFRQPLGRPKSRLFVQTDVSM